MRKFLVTVLSSAGIMMAGFFTEPLFPLGDWRWAALSTICIAISVLMYRKEVAGWFRESAMPMWWRKTVARAEVAAGLRAEPMRGIVELECCQQALAEYIRVPYKYPIGNREIAATHELLPHVERLCLILDRQNIPHPPIPDGLTFTGTGMWGRFLAKLLAVQDDLEAARRVYPGLERERASG